MPAAHAVQALAEVAPTEAENFPVTSKHAEQWTTPMSGDETNIDDNRDGCPESLALTQMNSWLQYCSVTHHRSNGVPVAHVAYDYQLVFPLPHRPAIHIHTMREWMASETEMDRRGA